MCVSRDLAGQNSSSGDLHPPSFTSIRQRTALVAHAFSFTALSSVTRPCSCFDPTALSSLIPKALISQLEAPTSKPPHDTGTTHLPPHAPNIRSPRVSSRRRLILDAPSHSSTSLLAPVLLAPLLPPPSLLASLLFASGSSIQNPTNDSVFSELQLRRPDGFARGIILPLMRKGNRTPMTKTLTSTLFGSVFRRHPSTRC